MSSENNITSPIITKRIAVIGAGPSGLVTLKTLLEEGHDACGFEMSAQVGGVYQYTKDKIGVYDSALLTSSAAVTSFSDFSPGKNAPGHFKHSEYFQYLKDYAAHYNLADRIKFNHKVTRVSQRDDRWCVSTLDMTTGTTTERTFDAVAICSGVHQNPLIPKISGLESFPGTVIHSGHYRTPDTLRSKKVLIVGGGESGSDLVDEISQVTSDCALSLRRGVLVVPRLIFGKPNDYYTSRLFYTIPSWFLRERDLRGKIVRSIILACLSLLSLHFLIEILLSPIYFLAELSPELDTIFALGINLLTLYLLARVIHYLFFYLKPGELSTIAQLNARSLAGHGEQFATKCQGIAKAIANKRCSLRPGIKSIKGKTVTFTDDTQFEADAIIFCTGYEIRIPYLNENKIDCRDLYKNCFDPTIGSSLCFIGLARPAIGAIPPIAEMQARWFSTIHLGIKQLPPENILKQELASDKKAHQKRFAVNSDRITGLVDFTSYMDGLADRIGCKPKWKDLLKTPAVLFRLYFNPFLACQYRLSGPFAKSEMAGKILTTASLDIFQFIFYCGFTCVIFWCAVFHRIGLRNFKPLIPLT